MSGARVKVVIPFRDRGIDPRRGANLDVVLAWWWAHGFDPCVVDDGLDGDAQFNRHRAYNRAVAQHPEADVFVFTEADILIPPDQIEQAVRLATRKPGLVVPFTRYQYLSDQVTMTVRDRYHDLTTAELAEWWLLPWFHRSSVFHLPVESVMDNGKSIGAVNVVSRNTLDLTGGFTEATSGNWYDDNIIEEAFAFLTGNKTAFVPGPAVHLYHLPGWTGEHLTDEDKIATAKNKAYLVWMRQLIASNDPSKKYAIWYFMNERQER